MRKEFIYPTPEKIIEYNFLALTLIKVKRADAPKVLNYQKIVEVIEACRHCKGDVYDKAVCLVKSIIQKHAFASGNRRTAFIVLKEFLISNHATFKIKDDPSHARVLQGVRENFYSCDEIKEWIKNGKIKEFRR